MKPLDLASGDLVADRRADYAEMLFKAGEHAAAVEVMLAALELAPGWALGWFRLGEMAEAEAASVRRGKPGKRCSSSTRPTVRAPPSSWS